MLQVEPRPVRSKVLLWTTPVIAAFMTMVSAYLLFLVIGVDPWKALGHVVLDPFSTGYNRSEMLVKAAPLALIALGLNLGFRAGVWNIGAEGQFTVGAICAGAVALAFYEVEGFWLFPLVCLAGIAGGMGWASIPAYLRTKLSVNEILVSLMLTYIAVLLLSALVSGPLRDPDGFNFPESRIFHDSAIPPILFEGTRAHIGIVVAPIVALGLWWLMRYHAIGFSLRLLGDAPRSARFAGFSENNVVWFCLLVSGGLAGLAGAFEVTGPIGQLVPGVPVGYGFTAIIVAFLGRLHPIGVLFSALALSVSYIGGESAQIAMSLPAALVGVLQGLLLFYLLVFDLFVGYRVRRKRPTQAIRAVPESGEPSNEAKQAGRA